MLIAFNKPHGVICQFSPSGAKPTLKDYIDVPGVYPAGRLDTDSEGLMLLTDDGVVQAKISDPARRMEKTYWVQVEGQPAESDLSKFRRGLDLGDFLTLPAKARCIDAPAGLWPRDPPIRIRAHIPTAWVEVILTEGKNRQVRRMTARIGFPTLRLIRAAIGPYALDGLPPGRWRAEAWPPGMVQRGGHPKKP
ncbi:MAG: pseudouridine synthase [Betaproteobacteria bacterium]|nr:pseudouridine synthase [Betaproteobacteria bacterium]